MGYFVRNSFILIWPRCHKKTNNYIRKFYVVTKKLAGLLFDILLNKFMILIVNQLSFHRTELVDYTIMYLWLLIIMSICSRSRHTMKLENDKQANERNNGRISDSECARKTLKNELTFTNEVMK